MTALLILDPMIRGGAIALFLLWIAILWRDHRAALAARVAIAMHVAIIAYLLSHGFHSDDRRFLPFAICDALSAMVPALFWLFVRLWFDDQQRIGWRSWLLVAAFCASLLMQTVMIVSTGSFSIEVWVLVRIGMFGFAVAGMWIAWRGRVNDLIEMRRRFRVGLVCAIGIFILLATFVEMFQGPNGQSDLWHMVMLTAIHVATFIVSVALYRFRSPDLFAAVEPPPKPARPSAAPSPLAQRLHALMAEERAYRAEGFSIAMLAARLGEPEYRVRRAINGEMGFRNFTAFLNSFRLDEIRAALTDPAQREVPILTIALDAGFGSLGPFNRAFRDAEGMTPTDYRARAAAARLGDSEIG